MAAQIIAKNQYELELTKYYKELGKYTDSQVRERFQRSQLNKLEAIRKIQNKNVVLGGLHRIKYKFYEHDRTPLVLFFSDFAKVKRAVESPSKLVPGINLHYLSRAENYNVVKTIKFFNTPRMLRGLPPALIWPMIDKMGFLQYVPYRVYRLDGILSYEYIPVADWESTARRETSRWQGFRDF